MSEGCSGFSTTDYPELDILEWPTSGEEKSPPTRRASEIKAVVRESWLSAVSSQDGLPPGWKQEVNEQGQVFYWHIPTGNIQYVRPEGNSAVKTKVELNYIGRMHMLNCSCTCTDV